MPRIASRGMFYVDRGKGYPIILIHGLGCSSSQWMYTTRFLENVGYRAVAPDLPGFGQSDLPKESIDASRYSEDIIFLMDHLRTKDAILMGNSMGGYISWLTAVKYPERVTALILVDPAGSPLFDNDNPKNWRRQRKAIVRITNSILRPIVGSKFLNPITRRMVRPAVMLSFSHASKATPEAFETLYQSGKKARILFEGKLEWIPPEEEPGDLLKSITCPVLVVWGEKDHIIPIKAKDFFMAHLPNAKDYVFKQAGHVPMLEVPDEFNQVIGEFLEDLTFE
jgi:pimeloyl-ACP methyl ester carboxylesterase